MLFRSSVYTDKGEVLEFDCKHKLSEMLAVVEESSHKTLVFCNFRHSIQLVQDYLAQHGYTSAAIHGGISAKTERKSLQVFRTSLRSKFWSFNQLRQRMGLLSMQPIALSGLDL